MKLFTIDELDQIKSTESKSEPIAIAVTPSVKKEEIEIKRDLKALGFPRGYYSDKLFKLTTQFHKELREYISLKKQRE